MPRDNEKIIQVAVEAQSTLKKLLIALIEADAPPDSFRAILEAIQSMGYMASSLAEETRRPEAMACLPGYSAEAAVEQLYRLDRIEKLLDKLVVDGGDRPSPPIEALGLTPEMYERRYGGDRA